MFCYLTQNVENQWLCTPHYFSAPVVAFEDVDAAKSDSDQTLKTADDDYGNDRLQWEL